MEAAPLNQFPKKLICEDIIDALLYLEMHFISSFIYAIIYAVSISIYVTCPYYSTIFICWFIGK